MAVVVSVLHHKVTLSLLPWRHYLPLHVALTLALRVVTVVMQGRVGEVLTIPVSLLRKEMYVRELVMICVVDVMQGNGCRCVS